MEKDVYSLQSTHSCTKYGKKVTCCFSWIFQDANIYVSEMKPHLEYSLSLSHNRQAYMVCIEGSLEINGVSLDQRDAIEILPTKGEMDLSITAGNNGTHLMLIEMSKQDSFQM